jgi:hypothetical protein
MERRHPERRHLGAQASCLRFAGILPASLIENASRMLANRRQDVGAQCVALAASEQYNAPALETFPLN